MSLYMHMLPQCGMTVVLELSPEHTIALVSHLIQGDDLCLNGSSFAVTSEAPEGWRCIYLSDASLRRYIRLVGDEEEFYRVFGTTDVPKVNKVT